MRYKTIFLFLLCSFLLFNCRNQELDKYGGYYDTKLGQYIYVKPGKSSLASNSLGIHPLKVGETQSFKARVVDVTDPDSVWIEVEDRQGYMILSQSLGKNSKNDQFKRLRVWLQFVKPQYVTLQGKNKTAWVKNVMAGMRKLLLNKDVIANVRYYKAGVIKGILMMNIGGGKKLNVSIWMINQGLSLYFKEVNEENPEEGLYIRAETVAEKNSNGIWKYR